MRVSRDDIILMQLSVLDLPGKELIAAAPRMLDRVLRLTGHAIGSKELITRILDIYENRSELSLKIHAMNDGHDSDCILGVKAALFRGHILTHVKIDLDKVGKWEFYDYILDLPWFEPYLVIGSAVDRFTHDRVLDLDFIQDYKESIVKAEVDSIVRFLNRGVR